MESARCKAFLTAAETGSFSKAAEALSYTPSGVSQLVSALEAELGLTLLRRSKRGVEPTENGKLILPAVRQFLSQENRIYELAAEINGLMVGSITIAAYSSISAHWLPGVIRDFQRDHPQIRIRLLEGIRQEVCRWLDDRIVDIAFLSYKEPMPYDWIPLADDPMIAVLPREHPLAGEKAYPLAGCQQERFIMPGLGRDDDVIELLRENGLSPEIAFTTLENFAAISMIEQNLGMSIMNRLITESWQCNVVKLPLDPPRHITLGIALHSLSGASPAVRAFVKYAAKRLTRAGE